MTGETTWTAPDAWLRAAGHGSRDDPAVIRAARGWLEKLDESSGRVYYVAPDGSSQWERPPAFDAPRWAPALRRSLIVDDASSSRDRRGAVQMFDGAGDRPLAGGEATGGEPLAGGEATGGERLAGGEEAGGVRATRLVVVVE